MVKRFTDTNKWDDPWFHRLSDKEKLFWIYICDKCDHAGKWKINWDLVGFHIPGFAYMDESFDKRIRALDESSFEVVKFIPFQYKTLDPNNRFHKSIIDSLGPNKALIRPLQGPKVKDKDKEQVLDKVKDVSKFQPPTAEEVTAYAASLGFNLNGQQFVDHYAASGWMRGKTKIKDWKACVRTWKANRGSDGSSFKADFS